MTGSAARRPDNRTSNGELPASGSLSDTAAATTALTALSMNASKAMDADDADDSNSRTRSPSGSPAMVAAPPSNTMRFGTLPARNATSASSAPAARPPSGPADPAMPSTI